ncbi:hypothetical protein VD0002_g9877 [Verticillium dahliae]|uniref:Uncharacterized protein n=1 Tax=Verticillium dahliae TaxID=27337 RepID=A0AA44W9T0_VERDA|nr:hypothetical protein BJF96_g9755 [Verticillium dahliae]PNH41050.1 hypothetical protein VD0003_g10022 [Verticillium dahliae]PNH55633.1 hypothetical protein VD0002_g9877 [Verticillium dahliae]
MDIAQILRNLESRFETSAPEGDVSGLLHANNFIPHLPLWTRDPECFFTGPVPSGVSHLRLNAIRRRILDEPKPYPYGKRGSERLPGFRVIWRAYD